MSQSFKPLDILVRTGARPLAPRVNRLTAPFWDGLAQGVFHIAHCPQCGHQSFPIKTHCPHCRTGLMQWKPVSGSGKVYTHTTVHAAPELFRQEGVYSLAIIDLQEGVRLVTRWVGDTPPECNEPSCLVILQYDDGLLFGACPRTDQS